jgi:outer membrane protein insertion porin family/translocation and assembly module TamA
MRARSAISCSLAGALTLAALGFGGSARAEEEATPTAAGPVVREIEFRGVQALETSDLAARLFTQQRPWWKLWAERPPFDEPTLEGDMQRIAATYREFGHYRARATYALSWDETQREVSVRIDVEEGPEVHLESFSIDLSEMPQGALHWQQLLVDPLPLRKGAVFTVANYGGAKRALLQKLADLGFPDATLSGGGEVDLGTNSATIDWTVHPGPRVRIGEIRVSGMKTVTEDVIRRELTFKPGDVYSDKDIQQSQRQVSDLGLFRSALIGTVIDPNAPPPEGVPPGKVTRPISVAVDERPLRSVRLGAGYGTEDKVRAQVGWLHRNVSGRADTLEVHARYSSLATEFQATLKEPHLPDPRTTLWLDSRIRDDTLPAYDDVALLGRVAVERPLRRGWSGQIGYDVEWTNVRKVTSADPNQIEQFRLGYLEMGVRRITADSLVEPTKGTWLEASVETASSWLGSQKDYVRWTIDGRAFLPVGPTVIAGRVLLGSITGFSRTSGDELPVTKLFYAGGSGTVRGYDYQHLGPDDAPGRAIGGESLLTGSLEWRFPIWRELRGATFLDAGQLSRDAWDWKPQELRTSVGFGFRYSTPLGPVRVDIAGPLNPPAGTDHVRLWFAIGQPF